MRFRNSHSEPLRVVSSRVGLQDIHPVQDERNYRLNRRHLIVCLTDAESLRSSQRDTLWFDDQKNSKHSQYVEKLRQLRSQLIDQETENLTHALARLEHKPEHTPRKVAVSLKRATRDPVQDAQSIIGNPHRCTESPTRHLQLMEEKRQRLKRLRQKPEAPKLDLIEGKRVSGPEPIDDRKSVSTDGETSLLRRLNREKETTPIIRRPRTRKPPQLSLDSQTMFPNGDSMVKRLLRDSGKESLQTRLAHDRGKPTGMVSGYRDEITISSGYMRHLWRKHDHGISDNVTIPAPTPLPQDFTLTPYTPPQSTGHSESDSVRKLTTQPERTNSIIHLPKINNHDSPQSSETGDEKKYLVVEMPQISCKPATPDSRCSSPRSHTDWRPSRSLMRVIQKHTLREREVRNLLEDVRDLNQMNGS